MGETNVSSPSSSMVVVVVSWSPVFKLVVMFVTRQTCWMRSMRWWFE